MKSARKKIKPNIAGRKPFDEEDMMLKIMYDIPKGLLEKDIAKALGMSHSTYFDKKNKSAKLREVIEHYRGLSAIDVLSSFKKIATGFKFDEETRELKKNKDSGKYELVVTKVVSKYIAPNAAAGQFYLKNMMPNYFQDKIENTHNFTGALDNLMLVIKGRD